MLWLVREAKCPRQDVCAAPPNLTVLVWCATYIGGDGEKCEKCDLSLHGAGARATEIVDCITINEIAIVLFTTSLIFILRILPMYQVTFEVLAGSGERSFTNACGA
jgi:hypothetical protein